LEIEEDTEPMWYLLNCIVTQELDLLRQCRARCGHMEDVVKFVVPIERSTRSHGPNRIVTDTRVGYPGYVFAKLRLCEEVYEAIQDLDLCRSWMGTVNKKGYRKLPPSPLALNEVEIEKFGLEELGEEVDFSDDIVQELMNEEGVIVDTAENEKKAKAKGAKIDKEQLQAYMDLRPDDMVKVIGDGKFKGEDGIVKRLKNGKLMIRFFTYGSTYEEWLDPKDVRKLTAEEVLRGLSGPSAPVTQHDLEGSDDMRDQRSDQNGSGGLRRALMSNVSGNRGPRNTRFETTQRGDRYKRDVFGRSDAERKNEEKKWSRDQDQQGARAGPRDAGGVKQGGQRDRPMADVDSQWGRYSQREDRRDRGSSDDRRRGQSNERRPSSSDRSRNPRNDRELQRVQSALDGGDWNAFVSPSPSPSKSPDQEDDAFFRSLMSELNGKQNTDPESAVSFGSDDDFFSSLMSELDIGEENRGRETKQRQQTETVSSSDDIDFFAALEAELGGSSPFDAKGDGFVTDLQTAVSDRKRRPIIKETAADDDGDDFFANLEKELSGQGFDRTSSFAEPVAPGDDLLAQGEADAAAPKTRASKDWNGDVAPSPKAKLSKVPLVSGVLNSESLAKSTVPVLKDMLRERGMKVSGSKSELIARLLQ
jgi:transcription antitermination factor NusG